MAALALEKEYAHMLLCIEDSQIILAGNSVLTNWA